MKKLYLLFLLFIGIFVSGCSSNETKVASNFDSFMSVASSHGLSVSDNSGFYSELSYISEAQVAQDNNITIEMVIYNNEDNAIKAQDNQIDNFKNAKSTGAIVEKNKGKNFYHYSQISNGYYMINSRIDNTLIFCKTLLENKDTVENIFNQLGY